MIRYTILPAMAAALIITAPWTATAVAFFTYQYMYPHPYVYDASIH